MKGIPDYRMESTQATAKEVARLTRKGMKQAEICKILRISRGMCRYYAVKEKTGSVYKPHKAEKICGNDLQKRNTKEDYIKYMQKNPHYFEDRAKGESLDKVCSETMLLRRHMRRGEAEFFLDGLPEGDGDGTLFSIGYDGRGHDS